MTTIIENTTFLSSEQSDINSKSDGGDDGDTFYSSEQQTPSPGDGDVESASLTKKNIIASPKHQEVLNNNIIWNNNTNNNDTDSEHDDKSDDDKEHVLLTENIYSFIYFSKYKSRAFLFGMFIFCFQFAIIVVTLVSLVDLTSENNPLHIPPDVDEVTTIGQIFATMLVPFTMGDLLESLVKFQEGYQMFDVSVHALKPGSSAFKWGLSVFLQFISGGGLLVVIFILILQSTTVIGIMLNFAALQFISEIDDLAFQLAKKGFVAKSIRLEAEEVSAFKTKLNRKTSNIFRRVCFMVVFLALLTGMVILISWQRHGKYLCNTIGIQFDDEIEYKLGTFSGIYELDGNNDYGSRATYRDRRSKKAMIAYCEAEMAWTFSYVDNLDEETPDPCNYAAKSEQTQAYDITTLNNNWLVYSTKLNTDVPLKSFELWCSECSDICDSFRGQCVGSRCECKEGFFGFSCRYNLPCETISVDQRTVSFPDQYAGLSSEPGDGTFHLLRDDNDAIVIVYGHPVYAQYYRNRKGRDYYNVMMFTGSRWVLETMKGETLNRIRDSQHEYHYYYHKHFNSSHHNPQYYFYSDPVNVYVPDTVESIPVGLNWYKGVDKNNPVLDMLSPIGTRVICSTCDDVNHECFNQGTCNAINSTCDCKEGYGGSLCEFQQDTKCSSDTSNNGNGTLCHNNGTCNDANGVCQCDEDHYGSLCQLQVYE